MADLNLSKFKKVGSDKASTKLKHEDGHVLVIAHTSLTPKLRKELDRLPIHAADGADIPDNSMPDAAPNTPGGFDVTAMDNSRSPASIPDATVPSGATNQSGPSAGAGIMQDAPFDPKSYIQNTTQDLLNEGNATKADMDNGHITPETYSDLFAKKDTLGKIGTIFGLMLGGAGSGLSHQPNALLAAMDKQIQNDLDAQKTTASNKQNWYKLNMQNNLNDKTLDNLVKTGKLTDEQKTELKLKNNATAYGQSLIGMRNSVVHDLTNKAQQIPPNSPLSAQAHQIVGNIANATQAANAATAASTASHLAARKQMYGGPDINEANGIANTSEGGNANANIVRLVKPGASVTGIARSGIAPEDVQPLQAQLAQADQAEKVINGPDKNGVGGIRDIMTGMWKNMGSGSYSPMAIADSVRAEGQDALGSIPYVGGALQGGMGVLPKDRALKEYTSSEANLETDMANALKGIMAPTDVHKIVAANKPVLGDSQADLEKKIQSIINTVKKSATGNLIEKWHMNAK